MESVHWRTETHLWISFSPIFSSTHFTNSKWKKIATFWEKDCSWLSFFSLLCLLYFFSLIISFIVKFSHSFRKCGLSVERQRIVRGTPFVVSSRLPWCIEASELCSNKRTHSSCQATAFSTFVKIWRNICFARIVAWYVWVVFNRLNRWRFMLEIAKMWEG